MSGFFGCVSTRDCVDDVFYGTDYHSHLGTKRAGLAFWNREDGFQRSIHSLEDGYFRNKFEKNLNKFKGNIGIGIISDFEAQPIVVNSHLGRFAVAHIGKINNLDELEQRFLKNRQHFSETSQGGINPTELVAMLICESNDFVSGMENVLNSVRGSSSIMVMTENGILTARDKFGRTPVIIGKNHDGYAVTFETSAFSNLNYTVDYYLGPGEIVKVNADGYEQLKAPGAKMQICSFLWVYYGYPPSHYEGINVDICRYKCGRALALKDDVEADFVTGIPDSGIGHSIGYSNTRSIPHMRPYCKYTPTWPRSFMPQNQDMRDLVAKMKLIPNKDLVDGKRGIFLDDSIVRGTQLKDNIADLHRAGIKEVHMRIACPPLTYPCMFLNFSRSRNSSELAARKAILELEGTEDVDLQQYSDPTNDKYKVMVENIKNNLGLTSLKYQELGDLVDAIGLPKEKLCTHCWDGSSYNI